MATDFTIILEDRPGELARVGEALGNAGVNIEGVSAVVTDGRGIVHLAVEDADAARSAFAGAGIEVAREADALLIEIGGGEDRPGTLGRVARKLADAGVNIEALYLAHHERDVVVTSDNETARSALQ
jgi:hypothetical protein